MQRKFALLLISMFVLQASLGPFIGVAGQGIEGGGHDARDLDPIANVGTTARSLDAAVDGGPDAITPLARPTGRQVPLSYDDVLLVVNDNSATSKEIGDYFVSKRPIPQKNICNITTSGSETVSRTVFDDEIRSPIESCIVDRGLEPVINYIVTTKGVPLRVDGSFSLRAAVDSELALILGELNSSIGNNNWKWSPYFGLEEPFSHERFGTYIVTRLTAYTAAEAKRLVDLADNSTGSRGLFAIDAGGPYGEGDSWLSQANQTLVDKGYNVSYDDSNVFQMHYKDVIGYASWGSNGQGYGSNYCLNYGFETDGDSNTIPDNWVIETDGGTWNRSDETVSSGTYAAKIVRPSVTGSASIIGQNITILPDTRYWLTGSANLSSVSADGGAHLFIRAYDATDTLVTQIDGPSLSGNRNWYGMGQVHYEAIPGVTKIMVGASLTRSSGTAFFDNVILHVIKPNNTYVPGAIGETFVSTGGRSFNYGTSYGQSLVADMVRQGISGISGHVYEPYLTACARPQVLLDRYTSGYTMGESFYMALPVLSWMEVVVGDPKMVPFWDLPDPAVEDNVTIDILEPAVDDEVTIKAKVYNRGGHVEDVRVQFYDGNPSSGILLGTTMVIPSLDRDESQWVEVEHIFTDDRAEIVTVVVDYADEIIEQRETNNKATISFSVGKRPDLVATGDGISFSSDDVLQGDDLHLNVTVQNDGGVRTRMTGKVNLTEANGTFFETHDIIVDPMNRTNISMVLSTDIDTSSLNGDLCIGVILWSSRAESNTSNNDASKCLFIKVHGFEVEQLTEELTVPPFGYANHSFNVTNTGNLPDHFTISAFPSDSIWVTEVTPDHLDLEPGETVTMNVTTFASPGLRFGDILEVNVTVTSTNSGGSWDLLFTSVQGATYEIILNIENDEIEIGPGGSMDIEVVVGNLGNADDNVTLGSTVPANWTVTFDEQVSTLPPMGFATRIATIVVAGNAQGGALETVDITAISKNGAPNVTRSVLVTVTKVFNISIEVKDDGPGQVPVGEAYQAKVVVRNFGNGNDTIALSGGINLFLSTTFEKGSVTMAPGTETVGITVTPSLNAPAGMQSVTIWAKSSGGQEVEASFALKILKADLAIKIVEGPDRTVKPGKKVTFKVEISSEGDFVPGAFNVTMSAKNDVLERRTVQDMTGTAPVTLTFEWTAEEGSWAFIIMVDPEDEVPETDESDNKVTRQVSVTRTSTGGPGSSGIIGKPWLWALVILIPLAYLALKVTIWSKRLRLAIDEGEAKRRKEREAMAAAVDDDGPGGGEAQLKEDVRHDDDEPDEKEDDGADHDEEQMEEDAGPEEGEDGGGGLGPDTNEGAGPEEVLIQDEADGEGPGPEIGPGPGPEAGTEVETKPGPGPISGTDIQEEPSPAASAEGPVDKDEVAMEEAPEAPSDTIPEEKEAEEDALAEILKNLKLD